MLGRIRAAEQSAFTFFQFFIEQLETIVYNEKSETFNPGDDAV
jgi:hypothetical protein